jgi:hypothetical protein
LGVGLLAALEGTANMRQLATRLGELGQMLLFPPNVKGWGGGRAWIDSSTLLGRANLVRTIVESPQTRFGGVTLLEYMDRFDLRSNGELVDWLCELLVAVPLPADVREQLVGRMQRDDAGLARAIHLLGALPEFQLA